MRDIKERTEELKARNAQGKTVSQIAVEKVSEKIGNATTLANLKANLSK